jgi:hypothetical protein
MPKIYHLSPLATTLVIWHAHENGERMSVRTIKFNAGLKRVERLDEAVRILSEEGFTDLDHLRIPARFR